MVILIRLVQPFNCCILIIDIILPFFSKIIDLLLCTSVFWYMPKYILGINISKSQGECRTNAECKQCYNCKHLFHILQLSFLSFPYGIKYTKKWNLLKTSHVSYNAEN